MALYSNTLAVVRQYLSSEVGDLILCTAANASTVSFTDTTLRKGDDYYNEHGYTGYCYGGSAIGQEREVSDFVDSGSTVVFDPAFSPSIANGDTFELHHVFTEKEYRRAINMGIEAAAGKYLVDLRDTTTITLVADTYEYSLPLSFLYLVSVTTEEEADGGTFNATDVVDPRDYSIIKSYAPKLKLHEARYGITAGKDLRLEGQGSQPIVDDDTDIIYLPPDWLVQKAITFLPQSKIESNNLDKTFQYAREYVATHDITNYPDPRAQRIVE